MYENRMTLRKWYGSSIRIPSPADYFFKKFVSSSIGIIASVMRDKLDTEISVRFSNSIQTAAADQEKKLILINSHYLEGLFGIGKYSKDGDEIISFIMGLIVHEAAHFAWSPSTLKPWAEWIEKNRQPGVPYSERIAMTLGNVIEDIYIEAEVDRTIPFLFWTLVNLGEFFFTFRDFEEAVNAAAPVTQPPQTKVELVTILNLLIFAKTQAPWVGMCNPYVDSLFTLARSAMDKKSVSDRFRLTQVIYDELMKQMTEEEMQGEIDLSELDVAIECGGAEKMTLDKAVEALAEKAQAGTGRLDGEAEGVVWTADLTCTEVNNDIHNAEKDNIYINFGAGGESDTTIFFREITVSPTIKALSYAVDNRFMSLAEVARQRSSVNRPYGIDLRRGNHIRKLARIVTDERIFAEPLRVDAYEPMQVMVVVDCSGSMRYNAVGVGSERRLCIQAALEAGVGATIALLNGRCDVALYGHTADIYDTEFSTVLYCLKAFGQPAFQLIEKAQGIYDGLALGNNRDGDALLYLSRKFTHQYKRRLMIVISDGMPNAARYDNQAAIEATTMAVERIRSQRIDVLSISINENANNANNVIYGKESNLFNEDPAVIESIIDRIIKG